MTIGNRWSQREQLENFRDVPKNEASEMLFAVGYAKLPARYFNYKFHNAFHYVGVRGRGAPQFLKARKNGWRKTLKTIFFI
jgi:hypothetical protein